jgi:tetratricopeptide (TPR) repeat protein
MDLKVPRIGVIAIILSVCSGWCIAGAGDANQTKTVQTLSRGQRPPGLSPRPLSQGQDSPGQISAELAKEYYKECVDTLKWALGIIIAIVLGFIAYAAFRREKEYRQALADVKEALRDARDACSQARQASDKTGLYEEKAAERLSTIDKQVAEKLKEIEDKGKASISELTKEAEKQREQSRKQAEKELRVAELWNDGLRAVRSEDFESAAKCFGQVVEDLKVESAPPYNNWGTALARLAERKEGAEADELLRQAFAKYEKAVQIKPDMHEAYNNWGNHLAQLAKRKEDAQADEVFKQAFAKYEKAVQIKPDKHEAYYNWGTALLDLARRKEGEERSRLLDEAKEKFLKAESIKQGTGAYNLACVYAHLGDEGECQKWLETGEEAGTLVAREKAMKDPDLESVRDKEWFSKIRWAED